MVSSVNPRWLYDGVAMLMRGHGEPLGIFSGSGRVSSVHGQPVLRGIGGGSSLSVGQRIEASLDGGRLAQ